MPVELIEVEPPEPAPNPPRTIVWLGLLVAVMLAGVVIALLTWPEGESTDTLWFWVRLLVFPALAWCVMFGSRLHYYDEETQRLQAEREVRAEDREAALRFASEPLAILGYTYLTASGSAEVAARIARGDSILSAGTSLDGVNAVRHTALKLGDDARTPERYRAAFNALLERIVDAATAIPNNVPFDVRLHVPADADQQSVLDIWQSCWREKNLRPAKVELLGQDQGLMVLDEWLDIGGGPSLERTMLFVSVQLHEHPPQLSAEAAVGILLGWAPLVERCGMKTQGLLHRPLDIGTSGLNVAVSRALFWGNATAAEIADLWQTGLSGADKGALLQAASDIKLGISQVAGLPGVHDIDRAIGNPGACAGLLAVALGIEHAMNSATPQLIAWHESTPRFAVVHAVRAQEIALNA